MKLLLLSIMSTIPWLQTYSESRGHNFTLNATFDEIEVSKYDGVIIPGGRAPEYLAINDAVVKLVCKFHDSAKTIACICHGQLILAAADIVKDRQCTAFPAVKPALVAAGAHWVEPETMAKCVSHDNLITGATYDCHPEFIRLFIQALGGSITGSNKRVLFLCGVCAQHSFYAFLINIFHSVACCSVVCKLFLADETL